YSGSISSTSECSSSRRREGAVAPSGLRREVEIVEHLCRGEPVGRIQVSGITWVVWHIGPVPEINANNVLIREHREQRRLVSVCLQLRIGGSARAISHPGMVERVGAVLVADLREHHLLAQSLAELVEPR